MGCGDQVVLHECACVAPHPFRVAQGDRSRDLTRDGAGQAFNAPAASKVIVRWSAAARMAAGTS